MPTPTDRPNHAGRRVAPWLVSLVVHGLILWVFGLITWIVAVRGQPDQLITLEPGGGGGGRRSAGISPERGRVSAARAQEASRPPSTAVPPAPAPQTVEARLERLLAAVSAETTNAESDPVRRLLESVGEGPGSGGGNSGGRGTGLGTGIGGGFGQYVTSLQQRGLDIVFVLDATNSMAPYIAEAKKRLQSILDVITGLVPKTRFGIVAYKDYGDDYGLNAVKSLPLSEDVERVRRFINDIVAAGGGDLPEPVHEALQVATNRKTMAWGAGRKHVIILIGDSPVHATGRDEAIALARAFAKAGGTLNVLDAGTAPEGQGWREQVQPDLLNIAQAGGGSAFLLRQNEPFWRHLIISTFDQRFKEDVAGIIDRYVKDR